MGITKISKTVKTEQFDYFGGSLAGQYEIGAERFLAMEPLFQPSLLQREVCNVYYLVVKGVFRLVCQPSYDS